MLAVPAAGADVPDDMIGAAVEAPSEGEYACAALPNIVNQDDLLQQVLAELRELRACIKNERIRRFNRRSVSSEGHGAPLQPLHREEEAAGGGHGPGALPPQHMFPATTDALSQLTAAQLNALEDFYGQQFAGGSVVMRRKSFSDYVCF